MSFHRLCFKLIWLLFPVKPVMTDNQKSDIWPGLRRHHCPSDKNFGIYSGGSCPGLPNVSFGSRIDAVVLQIARGPIPLVRNCDLPHTSGRGLNCRVRQSLDESFCQHLLRVAISTRQDSYRQNGLSTPARRLLTRPSSMFADNYRPICAPLGMLCGIDVTRPCAAGPFSHVATAVQLTS